MDNDALDIQEFYNDIAAEFAEVWYANDALLAAAAVAEGSGSGLRGRL